MMHPEQTRTIGAQRRVDFEQAATRHRLVRAAAAADVATSRRPARRLFLRLRRPVRLLTRLAG